MHGVLRMHIERQRWREQMMWEVACGIAREGDGRRVENVIAMATAIVTAIVTPGGLQLWISSTMTVTWHD